MLPAAQKAIIECTTVCNMCGVKNKVNCKVRAERQIPVNIHAIANEEKKGCQRRVQFGRRSGKVHKRSQYRCFRHGKIPRLISYYYPRRMIKITDWLFQKLLFYGMININKMNQQQHPDLDVEGISIQPRKLNWTKVLFDYHICLDAEAFEKWDGDLTMGSQQILEKDIPRTRCQDPFMAKQSFRQVLRRITTFYCKQNGVTYQQGLLQVVYPFALLRRKQFKTKKCYAYFNAFMRKHFPKVLVQRVVEGKKELPHAILAITLTQLLLRFHYPQISHIFKEHEIPMSLVATQQLLTIFAKNLPIKYVYEIYDYFIQKNDRNYIFYMEVALIGLQQEVIVNAVSNGLMHKEVQNLKRLNSIQEIKKWFALTQQIARKTPESFTVIANQFCFSNRNLLSTEDVDKMLKSQQLVADGYLPISIEQINKNVNEYVLVTLQPQLIQGLQKYNTIKINSSKNIKPEQFKQQKIYVLVVHEKNKKEQTQILMKLASKLTNCRFLMLRQHLVDGKGKKCSIF